MHFKKQHAQNQENDESKQHQALARAFALAQYHDNHRYALKPVGQTKKVKRPPRSFRRRTGKARRASSRRTKH